MQYYCDGWPLKTISLVISYIFHFHNLLQHRLDPRVFIYEFHYLTEVIPEVQQFDTCGSKSTEEIQCFFSYAQFKILILLSVFQIQIHRLLRSFLLKDVLESVLTGKGDCLFT